MFLHAYHNSPSLLDNKEWQKNSCGAHTLFPIPLSGRDLPYFEIIYRVLTLAISCTELEKLNSPNIQLFLFIIEFCRLNLKFMICFYWCVFYCLVYQLLWSSRVCGID